MLKCVMAGNCEFPAKYWVEMTRPCGCYHKSHSTPQMVCMVHAAWLKHYPIATRESECKQCGDTNAIKLLSLKTIIIKLAA